MVSGYKLQLGKMSKSTDLMYSTVTVANNTEY